MTNLLQRYLYQQVETLVYGINRIAKEFGTEYLLVHEQTLNSLPGSMVGYPPSGHTSEVFHKPQDVLYYGLGTGGYHVVDGRRVPYLPDPRELDLYQPLPFKLVENQDQLTDMERIIYRGCRRVVIDGTEYFGYYLKKLHYCIFRTGTYMVDHNGNMKKLNLDGSGLMPLPDPTRLETYGALDQYAMCAVTLKNLTLNADEIRSLADILYGGDISKVEISEVGLYSGYEDINDNKAYGVQLAYKYTDTAPDVMTTEYIYGKNITIATGRRKVW